MSAFKDSLSPSAARVQAVLDAFGLGHRVFEFTVSTRSAADAASAIGCDVAQIAKSLIFRGRNSGRPVLVLANGAARVDEHKVSAACGEPIMKADAAFVREATGFVIGGVCPVGHLRRPITLIDRTLSSHDEIWAAAGTPNAVFKLTPDQLVALTGGSICDITLTPPAEMPGVIIS